MNQVKGQFKTAVRHSREGDYPQQPSGKGYNNFARLVATFVFIFFFQCVRHDSADTHRPPGVVSLLRKENKRCALLAFDNALGSATAGIVQPADTFTNFRRDTRRVFVCVRACVDGVQFSRNECHFDRRRQCSREQQDRIEP